MLGYGGWMEVKKIIIIKKINNNNNNVGEEVEILPVFEDQLC